MRKKIIAGNWKMNLTVKQAADLSKAVKTGLQNNNHQVILCPPFPYISTVQTEIDGSGIEIGGQNCSDRENGAFTGEVSAVMLHSMNVPYVIIGHSERRIFFRETNELLREKVNIALHYGLQVIFCCGETKEIRLEENQKNFVENQLEESLFHLNDNEFQAIIIAYEPVWAIGTGMNASPAQAQDMHHFIREKVYSTYGQKTADALRILYGGSVKPENAFDLFSQVDVDGGLVGGASLNAEDFLKIINAL